MDKLIKIESDVQYIEIETKEEVEGMDLVLYQRCVSYRRNGTTFAGEWTVACCIPNYVSTCQPNMGLCNKVWDWLFG